MASKITVICGDDMLRGENLAYNITELVSGGLSQWLATVKPDGYVEVLDGVQIYVKSMG
jgi:hypothetical protein